MRKNKNSFEPKKNASKVLKKTPGKIILNLDFGIEYRKKLNGLKALKQGDFERHLKNCIKVLSKQKLMPKVGDGFLSLFLVDDKKMRKVNKDFRGINKTTDVVSLSYYEAEKKEPELKFKNPGEGSLIGEVFISLDTAIKQAKEHKVTLKQEVEFLFIHGVLHVLGFDHEKKGERKIMFDLQDEIFKSNHFRKYIDY